MSATQDKSATQQSVLNNHTFQNLLTEVQFSDRTDALCNKTKNAKEILPFVTTYDPVSQWFGYPRVLGTPVPKSLMFWVSPVGMSQWFGYPRVLGTPVPKSLVCWVSPVGIPKTLKALNTADWGKWNHQKFCSKTIYFFTKLCLNRLKLS